jgi:hypothetical protein
MFSLRLLGYYHVQQWLPQPKEKGLHSSKIVGSRLSLATDIGAKKSKEGVERV